MLCSIFSHFFRESNFFVTKLSAFFNVCLFAMDQKDKLQFINSKDGSHTLYNEALNETYHSRNGALTESNHVFIRNGLSLIQKESVSIFEVGFGTGLNALLTYQVLKKHDSLKEIHFHTIELYPLKTEITDALNYAEDLSLEEKDIFQQMHAAPWNEETEITPHFFLHKIEADLTSFEPGFKMDVVYFDAFGPEVQPFLWTPSIFERLFAHLKSDGVFTTYSAKGQVRRDLQSVGFRVERRPGPPGKREMLVAFKD